MLAIPTALQPARWPVKPTAFVLLGLFVVLDAFALAADTDLFPSLGDNTRTWAESVATSLSFSIVALIGVVVAVKRPENSIGWLLQSTAVTAVIAEAFAIYSRYSIDADPDSLVSGTLMSAISEALWLSVFAQLIFVFMLFPSGGLLSPRWRIVAWGIVSGFLASAISTSITAVADRHLDIQDSPAEVALKVVDGAAVLTILGFWLAAVWSLVLRYRQGTDDERHQMKWFAYPTALFTAFVAFFIVFEVATGEEPTGEWTGIVFAILMALPPLGIGVAVLKYRLYDIDILINRTLVYGPLTATLAGTYAAAILFFRLIFVDVLRADSDAAIAATTLAIAALFVPVKNRFQALVDRFFKEDDRRRLLAFEREVSKAVDTLDPAVIIDRYVTNVRSVVGAPVQVIINAGRHQGAYPQDAVFADVPHTIAIDDGTYTAGSVRIGIPSRTVLRSADATTIESAATQIARLIRLQRPSP